VPTDDSNLKLTRRAALGLSGGGLAAMILGGCGSGQETLRFRVTAEFATPRGIRTGSSVQELYHGGRFPLLPGGDSYVTRRRGEGIAVDIDGKTLFIVTTPFPDWLKAAAQGVSRTVPAIKPVSIVDWPANRPRFMRQFRDKKAVVTATLSDFSTSELEQLIFVRFKDIADPFSMVLVYPDDIESIFGSGVFFSRLAFVATDEPLSQEIGRRLPWLDRVDEYKFDQQRTMSATYWAQVEGLRV
jgi:hypothetical protein